MLEIELGVNLEVKLGVGSKTGSKNTVLAFLKCMYILPSQEKLEEDPFRSDQVIVKSYQAFCHG